MEDNSKLFVFDKKEVILIFVFMILITITSFTLGVRFGKSIYLAQQGITPKDIETIDLKSVEEESIESITESNNDEVKTQTSDDSQTLSETEERIKEEINKLANPSESTKVEMKPETTSKEEVIENETAQSFDEIYKSEVSLTGKYTIQLASFDDKKEAQTFADGFIASGYDAIVNKVEIPSKGSWYRVSVGLFDNLNDAKDYLEKEKKFFKGKDYLIKKFK